MNNRQIQVIKMVLSQWARRFRHDLAKETTVAVCFAVILATFSYVFGDFLYVQLRQLSNPLFAAGTATATSAVALLMGYTGGTMWGREHADPRSLSNFMRALGAAPLEVSWAQRCRKAMIYGLSFIPVITMIIKGSTGWRLPALSLTLYVLALLWGIRRQSKAKPRQIPNLNIDSSLSPPQLLLRWRWYGMLRRNRSAQLALGLGTFATAGVWLGIARHLPFFVIALLILVSSVATAMAIASYFRDDLASCWLERQAGISHGEIFRVYDRIGLRLGGCLGLAVVFPLWLSTVFWQKNSWIEVVQAFGLALLCPWVMPSLLLQVDGRRPLIQLMLITVVGLFVGTAILAHPLAILLVPIVKHYLGQSQVNRFYRA